MFLISSCRSRYLPLSKKINIIKLIKIYFRQKYKNYKTASKKSQKNFQIYENIFGRETFNKTCSLDLHPLT